jgi:hypothetical protein
VRSSTTVCEISRVRSPDPSGGAKNDTCQRRFARLLK